MTAFTKEQQSQARKSFIEKSRENAWSAACHADFLAKTMEGLFAEHQKLIDEDTQLETEIKTLDNTTDYHTVENRMKHEAQTHARGPPTDFKADGGGEDGSAAGHAANARASANRRVQLEARQTCGDMGVEGDGEQAGRNKIHIMKAFLRETISRIFWTIVWLILGRVRMPAARAGARESCADFRADVWDLTIPLISNDAVDLGKKRLLKHKLAELFHERPQAGLLHGWNELIMQATLSQQGMCPPLGGAGFEMLVESESLAGGAEHRQQGDRENIEQPQPITSFR
jgi:hypothetical protein